MSQAFGNPMIEFEGLEESLKNLELTEKGVTAGVNNSLRMGGDLMKDYVSSYTPIGDGDNQWGHAKDNVSRSGVRTDGGTAYKHVMVGYNQNVYWYMWFLEKGTYSKGNPKGISPRNHVEKAFKDSHSNTERFIAMHLEEVIRGLPL